jgi:hypothetical protein
MPLWCLTAGLAQVCEHDREPLQRAGSGQSHRHGDDRQLRSHHLGGIGHEGTAAAAHPLTTMWTRTRCLVEHVACHLTALIARRGDRTRRPAPDAHASVYPTRLGSAQSAAHRSPPSQQRSAVMSPPSALISRGPPRVPCISHAFSSADVSAVPPAAPAWSAFGGVGGWRLAGLSGGHVSWCPGQSGSAGDVLVHHARPRCHLAAFVCVRVCPAEEVAGPPQEGGQAV